MPHPEECQYCAKDRRLTEIMIEICPLRDGACWGKPFELNPPDKTLLDDEGYQAAIQEIAGYMST